MVVLGVEGQLCVYYMKYLTQMKQKKKILKTTWPSCCISTRLSDILMHAVAVSALLNSENTEKAKFNFRSINKFYANFFFFLEHIC